MWRCFSGYEIGTINRITDSMTATVYRDLLNTVMLPYAECAMPISWTFHYGNDPKHTARLVKTWIEESNIKVMEWPPQSPDLNPIENMWMAVKRSIGSKVFRNGDDLFVELEKQWNSITMTYVDKLIDSMPKRCSAVLKNNGYATKY